MDAIRYRIFGKEYVKLQNRTTAVVLTVLLLASSCTRPNVSTESPTGKPTTPGLVTTVQTTQPAPLPTEQAHPSPTAITTLPVDEARTRLLDLLAHNGNCDLSCFWNITPGKSSFQEASAILVPLTSISGFTAFESELGNIDLDYYVKDNVKIKLNISILADSNGQTVNSIRVISRVLEMGNNSATLIFDSPYFDEHLNYYMLPNVLAQYGEPSTVMLSTMAKIPNAGDQGGFKILLLYPDQGVLINYTMQMQIVDKNIMGCPSNSHVELDLHPSGQGYSFFDLLDQSGWFPIIQNTYKPIDEATSMTKESFYQIFSQQTDRCISTPANLWPVPN